MHQKVNSSVSKGATNSFNEMFPLARMIPQAVMHRGYQNQKGANKGGGGEEIQILVILWEHNHWIPP